jgi:predicted ATPase/class 3 adenylate cyclase/Tfp pilus assembly protein PilF
MEIQSLDVHSPTGYAYDAAAILISPGRRRCNGQPVNQMRGPIIAPKPARVGAIMLPDTLIASRYRLTDPLGKGGSGTVYRAIDLRTGGTVAVKILHPGFAHEPEYTARLRREAVLAASLTSPRIVRVTDVGEHAASPFLVMEFVSGPTLQDRLIEQGRLSVDEALAIGLEVARAMVAAHAGGVVHRDLKPHNIKLPEGQVKVLDFGTARFEANPSLTMEGVYVGTPDYSAPERAHGQGDIRADIYSLGVILFQMIEGRLPFHSPTPLGVLHQHAVAPTPAMRNEVSTDVKALIARCMAKAPAARYQSAADLVAALATALHAWSGAIPGAARAASELLAENVNSPETLDLPSSRDALPGKEADSTAVPPGVPLPMPSTGVLTFLQTDVEGSTRLWEQCPDAMRAARVRHDVLVEALVAEHHGLVVRPSGEGDSRFAVFGRATDAVAAACALQVALTAEAWPTPEPLRVRMALHTGEADLRDGDYCGTAVNRCARLRGVAHGSQVVLSGVTCRIVAGVLPLGASLRELGTYDLDGLAEPELVSQLLHPELPADFPALKATGPALTNLPSPTTQFIGRQPELEQIESLFATARLLTLVGTGGIGKTRVALEAASTALRRFPQGVWLVELAPVDAPLHVPRALAATLGIQEQTSRSLIELLVDHLRAKCVLLVLDNCEHLIQACADLAAGLLRSCPDVRILATSREPLLVPGEVLFRVQPLGLPVGDDAEALTTSEAGRLFLARALAAEPAFAVDGAAAAAVAQVCRRLDGLPLAIELAAARVGVLSPLELAPRLEDSFRVLVGGGRTLLPRQQTMHAAISWSYELLTADAQRLFEQLSVFAGGFTLSAAEAVGEEDVLTSLTQLVSKSTVQAQPQDDSTLRYRLLEPLRQYARERLIERGDLNQARRRHAAYLVGLAERLEPELYGPVQGAWFRRLYAEFDNIRTAHDWAVETGETEVALRLGAALWGWWSMPERQAEGRVRLAQALALPGAEARSLLRGRVLGGLALLALQQGDQAAAAALVDETLAIARQYQDPGLRGLAMAVQGGVSMFRGELTAAEALFLEALDLSHRAKLRVLETQMLERLAHVALARGDVEHAEGLINDEVAAARAAGNPWSQGMALNSLGEILRVRGEYQRAGAAYEEALVLFRLLEARGRTPPGMVHNLGYVALGCGDARRAIALFLQSADAYRDVGADQRGVAECVMGLAGAAVSVGQPELAGRLYGAAEAALETLGTSFTPTNGADYKRGVAALRAALDEEQITAHWASGRTMSLGEAISAARTGLAEAPPPTAGRARRNRRASSLTAS